MKFSEYRILAQRTSSTTTKDDKIIHGYLGLLGEIGECIDVCKKNMFLGMSYDMAKEKLLDELGDICWYIAELATGYDSNLGTLDTMDPSKLIVNVIEKDIPFTAKSLLMMAEYVLGIAQCSIRYIWAEHSYEIVSEDAPIQNFLVVLMDHMMRMAKGLGYDISEVFEHNIEKLKKRYPSGFNAEISNARYEGDVKE